jgi:hypothetical protein
VIETGNIEQTSGAAIGQGNQAQSVTIHQHLEAPPERATTSQRLDWISHAMLVLNQMFTGDRKERDERQKENDTNFKELRRDLATLKEIVQSMAQQSATDYKERDRSQHESDAQFAKIDRRLDVLEELVRSVAQQSRTDRLFLGGGVVILFVFELGKLAGWW